MFAFIDEKIVSSREAIICFGHLFFFGVEFMCRLRRLTKYSCMNNEEKCRLSASKLIFWSRKPNGSFDHSTFASKKFPCPSSILLQKTLTVISFKSVVSASWEVKSFEKCPLSVTEEFLLFFGWIKQILWRSKSSKFWFIILDQIWVLPGRKTFSRLLICDSIVWSLKCCSQMPFWVLWTLVLD